MDLRLLVLEGSVFRYLSEYKISSAFKLMHSLLDEEINCVANIVVIEICLYYLSDEATCKC